jgi:glycosyltransferase involved in cell wall biosynthesis
MAIQLYSTFGGYSSFAVVGRAIAHELRHRHQNFTIYGTDTLTVRYDDVRAPISLNNRAIVGVYVGYPSGGVGWLSSHKHRVLVTVCETSPIPPEWSDACNRMTLVVVPSQYCKDVLERNNVRVPIMVVAHGVDEHVLTLRPAKPVNGRIRLLHVTEAGSFPERKGTPQLMMALSALRKEFPLELTVKTKAVQQLEYVGKALGVSTVVNHDWMRPNMMMDFMRTFDLVVQPSRAEGFGIVPLEARCQGIPVVLTNATGHTAHFQKGVDVDVHTGPVRSMQTQGNELGLAPSLKVIDVEVALRTAFNDLASYQTKARAWATVHAASWSWQRTLRPFVKHLDKLDDEDDARIGVGEEAGLRGA